VLKFL
jgi:hypothetical protein